MPERTCSIEGCEKTAKTRGWCGMHYARWLRHGDTDPLVLRGAEHSLSDRFWQKVRKSSDHWWWTGGTDSNGYGQINHDGTTIRAHRFAYEQIVGPIPGDLTIDHLCRTPLCVNPAHMEPVTARVNTLRSGNPAAQNARKTHCKWGHPFDELNTRVNPNGTRTCRTCVRLRGSGKNRQRRSDVDT